jgi:hypothetical protein
MNHFDPTGNQNYYGTRALCKKAMKINPHALATPMFNVFVVNFKPFILNSAKIIYMREKYG